jgi:FkbM family methyltransferase
MYSVDADATAEHPPQTFASSRHFPVALYSAEGEMELIVTEQPGMSSLLEFDSGAFDRHFGLICGSRMWRQGFTPKRRQKTSVTTLDSLLRSQGLSRIDFLKLDAQGTELEILKGAREYLSAGRISIIKTEVMLLPVYRNQCTFSEIDHFLKGHGYLFVDCAFYPDAVHTPVSAKAVSGVKLEEQKRFSGGGDAFYMLRPDKCVGDERRDFCTRSAILLNQLGYVSLAFDLLKSADYSAGSAEQLLRATAKVDPRARWKRLLKDQLPPWAYRRALQIRWSLQQRRRRSASK